MTNLVVLNIQYQSYGLNEWTGKSSTTWSMNEEDL